MQVPDDNRSLWKLTTDFFHAPPPTSPQKIDVAIVGGGITGLTAALRLQREGKTVAIFDKGEIAGGESGNTTAHLTEAVDARYKSISKDFGDEGARLVARASREAIDSIEALAASEGIDCQFERVSGFLYTEKESDRGWMEEEAEISRQVGISAQVIDSAPLPFQTFGAIRYENQAQFHPRKYLLGLANAFLSRGGQIYDQTLVEKYEDGSPCTLVTSRGEFEADHVLLAANSPLNLVLIVTKVAAYRTYAIASRITTDVIPRGLFWDTADPYHYTRRHTSPGGEFLIIGGNDHKTGTEDETSDCYEDLIAYAGKKYGINSVEMRWSGQILEPVDGLPYIGLNSASKNTYIATGFSGQGMTFGTIAGAVLSDLVLGRENRYSKLFDATRIKPLASAVDYVTENVDFPKYLLSDRLSSWDVDGKMFGDVKPGEGMVLEVDGRKLATHRAKNGTLHCFSAVCPHLKCDVRWNDSERSWDCPCHGSRFKATGEVLNGPAMSGLEKIEVAGKE